MQGQQDDDFEDPQNPGGWHPPLLAPKPKPGPWAPDDPTFEDPNIPIIPEDPILGPFDIPGTTPTFTAPTWPEPEHPTFGPLAEPEFWGQPSPPEPPPIPGGLDDDTFEDPLNDPMGQQEGRRHWPMKPLPPGSTSPWDIYKPPPPTEFHDFNLPGSYPEGWEASIDPMTPKSAARDWKVPPKLGVSKPAGKRTSGGTKGPSKSSASRGGARRQSSKAAKGK